MNKRIKQFVAVLSAIALIISSVTVYRSEKVNAAGEWTEITGLKYQSNTSDMTLYYQVAKGNEGQPISRDGDFYLMVRPENFASENSVNVYFDEGMTTEGTTPIADGVGRKDAYQYIMGFAMTANNVQENTYYSLRFEYGTYDVVYYFYTGKDPESGGGGGGGETPTQPGVEDGTEILHGTQFTQEDVATNDQDMNGKWIEYGADSWTNNGNGSVTVSVPAKDGGDVWSTQLKQNNVQLTQGKWYKITCTIQSDVAKLFEVLLQPTDYSKEFVKEQVSVTAGGTETFEYIYHYTEATTNQVLFGIMMGYIGTASAAATVTISDVSVTVYNEEPTAGGYQAPSSAILYNLTDAGKGYKAVIKDNASNVYEEGTPSYQLYVNNTLIKTVTDISTDISVTEEELAAANPTDDAMNSFAVAVKATKDGEEATSPKSAATKFYYKSETVIAGSHANEVPKVFVSTSRTSKTESANIYTDSKKTKIDAGLVVADKENKVLESNSGTIKLRGNSTAEADKKAYNITFDAPVNLFNFGSAKKWSLLANIFDKTLLRNQIAMDFQRALEKKTNQNQVYTSNCKTVDLYIDGKYMGTYTLIESVETGKDRVDIDVNYLDESDNIQDGSEGKTGPSGMQVHDVLLELANDIRETSARYDTEAYYFETKTDNEYFAINYPARNEDLSTGYEVGAAGKPAWVDGEIKAYVDAFETTLNTGNLAQIENYIDIDSFVDFYITSEYFKTKDINFSSTRFYIKDGKMYAGPLWDLDLSSGNSLDRNGTDGFYAQNMVWFQKLMNIPEFKNQVSKKYQELQPTITELYRVDGTVDQAVAEIQKSVDANYSSAYVGQTGRSDGWKLDHNYGAYNSTVTHTTYAEYITDYKNWLKARNEWLLSMLDFEADYETNDNGVTTDELLENEKQPSGAPDTTWYDYTNYFNVSSSTDEVDADYGPKLAYDDNLETRWGTAASDNHWIQIDLGATRAIREIDIIWETASAAGYTVEGSTDGGVFTPIAVITGRTEVGNSQNRLDTITFDNDKEYQYIRINCQSRATDYGFSIRELAIYGPDEQFDDVVVDNGESALTADKADLSVEGFQIQANDEHNDGYVNFRTVCKAPNIGESISAGGKPYTVRAYGTIYALDFTNTSGDHNKDNIKVYHTMLKGDLQDIGDGVQAHLGANTFGGKNRTYGYEATPIGTINGWDPLDPEHTYYSRTMTKMDENMANTIYVRAFVVAESGEFIYSEDTAEISVAEIADYLYENSMSKNVVAHEYLFNNILHNTILQEAGSTYWREQPKEYGWNGSLYTPQNSMFS